MANLVAIADNFLTYNRRVPYVWGGASPRGWDCSGAVNYVVCHNMGYDIPGYLGGTFTGRSHGPNTTMWYGFARMRNVARANVRKGIICLWSSHMGIAISGTHYISAFDTQLGTVIEPIHGGGPVGETASFWELTQARPRAHPGGGGGGGGGGGPATGGKEWDEMQAAYRHLSNTLGHGGDRMFRRIYTIQKRMEKLRRR